jgi:mono/diheme cytochrome c family protein
MSGFESSVVASKQSALASLKKQAAFAGIALFTITATAIGALMIADAARLQAKTALTSIDVSKYQPASVARGRARFMETCAACHGSSGVGMPRQGANLRLSPFVSDHNVGELAAFIRNGRPVNDPKSVMQLPMPPLGGNPSLSEQQLIDIAAYLRVLQEQAQEELRANAQSTATR